MSLFNEKVNNITDTDEKIYPPGSFINLNTEHNNFGKNKDVQEISSTNSGNSFTYSILKKIKIFQN